VGAIVNLERFKAAFPTDPQIHADVDGERLWSAVVNTFAVKLPMTIRHVWELVGSGYYGERLLYLFGDGRRSLPRASLVEWNAEAFWREIYPPANQGGPIFFAETCFGEQIGARLEANMWVPILFIPDTFETFRLADDFESLFERVLVGRYAIDDPDRVARVIRELGPPKPGMHYAPIVSPMVGGGDDAGNFHLETPSVHLRTALATFQAVAQSEQ
jgi:hypothetical protein